MTPAASTELCAHNDNLLVADLGSSPFVSCSTVHGRPRITYPRATPHPCGRVTTTRGHPHRPFHARLHGLTPQAYVYYRRRSPSQLRATRVRRLPHGVQQRRCR